VLGLQVCHHYTELFGSANLCKFTSPNLGNLLSYCQNKKLCSSLSMSSEIPIICVLDLLILSRRSFKFCFLWVVLLFYFFFSLFFGLDDFSWSIFKFTDFLLSSPCAIMLIFECLKFHLK
jgi:hypothetical protein